MPYARSYPVLHGTMSKHTHTLPRLLRDRGNLLHAASIASERLEARCADGDSLTVTLTRDELRELTEQFGRVVALLSLVHIAEASGRHAA